MHQGRVLADRYEILAPIAEGASGSVWEARDRKTAATVALKVVSMEQAGWRAEVRDRFQQEARLLEKVHSPHLVGVHGLGETDDGLLYLVLERLRGDTLAARLSRPPRLNWREAATIAQEIAKGLAALHEHGIVHRDLKPANIVLHGDPSVCKIIDLGISKTGAAAADPVLYATLTATGQVLGTPEYMSHEQAVGARDVDARTDVWALGAVLYEMLAGRRPFTGPNVNAVLAAIRGGPPPPLAGVAPDAPAALIEIIERCLAPDRDERFADGGELAVALEEVLTRGSRFADQPARRRWLFLALGGLGVAAVLTAGIVAAHSRNGSPAVTSAAPAASVALATGVPEPKTAATALLPAETGAPAAPAASASAAAPKPIKSARPVSKVNTPGF